MKLLFDELMIISILKGGTPEEFVAKATEVLPYYDENNEDDVQMINLIQRTIQKVKQLSLKDFQSLDIPCI